MARYARYVLAVGVLFMLSGCQGGMIALNEPQARQWRVREFTFVAASDYDNPANDVELSVVFEGPEGARFVVPSFWDGEKRWKARFAPTVAGQWTYSTSCNPKDTGLDAQAGQFLAVPAHGGDNPIWQHGGFLRVSENSRYLTYSDGTPFFWLGDTWWFCPSSLVPFDGSSSPQYESMYRTLIDTRQRQGYTVVHWAFLGPMAQSSGVNSFRSLAWHRRIDVSYWQEVDRYVEYANAAGIIPVIGLAFSSGMDDLSLEEWQFLWRYVIARYGAHAITWLICGEYNHEAGDAASRIPKVMALGQFIKETDPYHRAMTVHPWWHRGDKRQAWDKPWYDFAMLQGAHQSYPSASLYLDTYHRPDPKPLLEGECNYEGIRGMTDVDVRWAAYRAIQSGSFGYTYGAHGLWYPTQDENDKTFDEWGTPIPWWEALAMPGGAQMQHLRELYESVQWWTLEPRAGAVKIPQVWPEMMAVLAKARGDDLFLLYFGRGLPTEADAVLSGVRAGATYSATWFDPRTGERKTLSPLSSPNEQLLLPERPDNQDWVLILERDVAVDLGDWGESKV